MQLRTLQLVDYVENLRKLCRWMVEVRCVFPECLPITNLVPAPPTSQAANGSYERGSRRARERGFLIRA